MSFIYLFFVLHRRKVKLKDEVISPGHIPNNGRVRIWILTSLSNIDYKEPKSFFLISNSLDTLKLIKDQMNLSPVPVSCQISFLTSTSPTLSAVPFSLFYHWRVSYCTTKVVCANQDLLSIYIKTFKGTPSLPVAILSWVRINLKEI